MWLRYADRSDLSRHAEGNMLIRSDTQEE